MENQRVLILDEPFNGLDADSVQSIRDLLAAHVRDGGTLIFTSHDKDDIDHLATDAYRINRQRLEPL